MDKSGHHEWQPAAVLLPTSCDIRSSVILPPSGRDTFVLLLLLSSFQTLDTWLVNMIAWRLAAEATTLPHA